MTTTMGMLGRRRTAMGRERSAKREDPAARRRMDKATRRAKIVKDWLERGVSRKHVYPDPEFSDLDHDLDRHLDY
jgi:hypothetical protein